MIDLYYWPTPNGWKASIMLEECGLAYRLKPLDITRGAQFRPEFLAISPNNRMPAIVDDSPAAGYGSAALSIFESGAILLYLAQKAGRFLPEKPRDMKTLHEWVFWQVGNLGPMAGQLSHFVNYAPGEAEGHEYARKRYAGEYNRCLGVLERRLEEREYLLGDTYTIADIICWPWVFISKPLGQPLDDFPNVARWREAIKQRPSVQAGVDLGKAYRGRRAATEADRRRLFNQSASSVNNSKQ